MHDHFNCGNYKFCPHCARAGSAKMRDYITQVFMPAAKSQGYARALMTLTASHRRDCDWKADYADLFYKAVTLFSRRMGKAYKAIGCPGQFRAMESPVGPNGLHLHILDEMLYRPGADIEAFESVAARKWCETCREVGLYCNAHGLHITTDFDPCYIAKDETQKEAKATAFELAAYDTKTKATTARSSTCSTHAERAMEKPGPTTSAPRWHCKAVPVGTSASLPRNWASWPRAPESSQMAKPQTARPSRLWWWTTPLKTTW